MRRYKYKPKFNKAKCRKCKYSAPGRSIYICESMNDDKTVYCNYSGITKETCLSRDKETGKTVDKRGNDFDHCKLFKKKE